MGEDEGSNHRAGAEGTGRVNRQGLTEDKERMNTQKRNGKD